MTDLDWSSLSGLIEIAKEEKKNTEEKIDNDTNNEFGGMVKPYESKEENCAK